MLAVSSICGSCSGSISGSRSGSSSGSGSGNRIGRISGITVVVALAVTIVVAEIRQWHNDLALCPCVVQEEVCLITNLMCHGYKKASC